MSDAPLRRYTVVELDRMTPEELAALPRPRPITDLSTLPPAFRAEVERRGREIAEQYGLLPSQPAD